MYLIRVYSNQKSFREVNFNNPSGINFIIAKQKNPETTDLGKTYNGVGKSLLVRIIHFCLGAKNKSYKSFCEKLKGWEFYLEFKINDNTYTVKRSTDKSQKIFLNNEELSINNFNKKLQNLCFEIPDNISFLTFRSLIPFFIRSNKESYVTYKKPGKTHSDYQILLYNAFLLGLDITLAQKKYDIRKEKERIKELEKNFKNDSLLRDFFTGNKDVSLTLIDLDEKINRLDSQLKNYKVAEDYYDVQKEADKIENELFELNNNILLLENSIENIDKSLVHSPDLNKKNIESIYKEVNIHFSENVNKTLDELESFYEKLISNRKKRLLEQQNKLKFDLQVKKKFSKELQSNLDKLMTYLGEHQALDLFIKLTNKSAELKSERENLQKYQELQSEYKTKERQAEKEFIELTDYTELYLSKLEIHISELRDYFRNLAKIFYPNSAAGLTIENDDGDNQLRFNIDAKIESDASDGINNVKIFCYDLTMLFKGKNHRINFIFHDSRLFDGTDERQKTSIFKIINERIKNSNKQYIATINQNQLEEIKKHLTDAEYNEIINQNIILTLTDDSDSEKLLGIKVDIGEE